eukprot:6463340-Amphidinium_carterae.2
MGLCTEHITPVRQALLNLTSKKRGIQRFAQNLCHGAQDMLLAGNVKALCSAATKKGCRCQSPAACTAKES